MERRHFLRDLTLTAGVLAVNPAEAQHRAAPNFIVIVLDDLGCTDLGCYGASDLKTPNIDALARSGARFTNWYSNASLCAPARASLMTGRYPVRAGVTTNGPVLPKESKTLPEFLKTKGYATGLVGNGILGDLKTERR
jgi:arylsulfatase A-like enzyme